mmetsp:Transcript_7042/g.17127  ORF Transcript_7042/g.17127 Transcript_7042/m.17127 type:complete len:205 (-) Transcript_7042:100-714(-)
MDGHVRAQHLGGVSQLPHEDRWRSQYRLDENVRPLRTKRLLGKHSRLLAQDCDVGFLVVDPHAHRLPHQARHCADGELVHSRRWPVGQALGLLPADALLLVLRHFAASIAILVYVVGVGLHLSPTLSYTMTIINTRRRLLVICTIIPCDGAARLVVAVCCGGGLGRRTRAAGRLRLLRHLRHGRGTHGRLGHELNRRRGANTPL